MTEKYHVDSDIRRMYPDLAAAIDRDNNRARLEELRAALRAENISYGELAELADLAPYIAPGDVELLEPAGVPEELAYMPIAERMAHRDAVGDWSTPPADALDFGAACATCEHNESEHFPDDSPESGCAADRCSCSCYTTEPETIRTWTAPRVGHEWEDLAAAWEDLHS